MYIHNDNPQIFAILKAFHVYLTHPLLIRIEKYVTCIVIPRIGIKRRIIMVVRISPQKKNKTRKFAQRLIKETSS